MNLFVKTSLARLANSKTAWPLFKGLRKVERALDALCAYVERQRDANEREDLKTLVLRDRFSDLIVRHGPFSGLVYPDAVATGSALLPKLLGSYEDEIHPFITTAAAMNYDDVIDIGCAEGYYAVGLGRLFPKARVLAYDVDEGAREMCRMMAEANGVADRVELNGWCDAATLASLPEGRRALIVADCEGYEKTLFTAETAASLIRHDILIECHDYKEPDISASIRAAFAATHEIEEAPSTPDYRKAADAAYPELEGYSPVIRRFIVEESRSAPQSWLFLKAKAFHKTATG